MTDRIALTPPGWAVVATAQLIEQFPELAGYDLEIQVLLLPLFRKAVDIAIEKAYTDILHPPPSTESPHGS